MALPEIYAVTNQGYYAMNHVRMDRKLKTNFGDFWAECGGSPSGDRRFYRIPLEEVRRDLSELKPSSGPTTGGVMKCWTPWK